jgi:hypothetical protein
MEPRRALPCSENPVFLPYPEPDLSSSHPHVTFFLISIIIIIFLQGLGQRSVPVQNLTSELMNLYGHLVGLLGRGISPRQVL